MPRHLTVPPFTQVSPSWVDRLNEVNLARPPPSLNLLLPGDCLHHFIVTFVVDQPRDTVPAREARYQHLLVLKYAPLEIVRDPDVESAGPARNDVDETRPAARIRSLCP